MWVMVSQKKCSTAAFSGPRGPLRGPSPSSVLWPNRAFGPVLLASCHGAQDLSDSPRLIGLAWCLVT
ncbi:unnamed protein product [Gadus morhua 'NCC']